MSVQVCDSVNVSICMHVCRCVTVLFKRLFFCFVLVLCVCVCVRACMHMPREHSLSCCKTLNKVTLLNQSQKCNCRNDDVRFECQQRFSSPIPVVSRTFLIAGNQQDPV